MLILGNIPKCNGWLALVLVGVIATARAEGQSTLTGVVRDARSNEPIAGAEVLIGEIKLVTRTDAKGRFLLDNIYAGRHAVVARKIGYDSVSVALSFSGADSAAHDFTMTMRAQPLPEVPIRREGAKFETAKLREFDRRREHGIGRFLTGLDLEKQVNKRLSDVAAHFPGVLVVPGRATRNSGGGTQAAYLASSRGHFSIETQSAFFGTRCPIAIWLDGVAVYRGNDLVKVSPVNGVRTMQSLGMDEPPFDINQINMRSIAAIEFYAGPSEMPPELNITAGACGALVIWTK